MTEVREVTHVRRMRTLKVYTLESSVTAVPCLSGGVAKDTSFKVSLYLSENNKDRTPYKAKIRYKRCNGQSCEAFVTSPVAVDAVSVDTGKNVGKVFDRYFIEAFEQNGKEENILATLHVPTVVDGQQGEAGSAGPLLVPYGSWDAKRTYRSTSDVKIFVERKRMYYVLTKLNADCVGIDPATDVKNEYWRLMDYVEYMFVNAMVADFGKIGSAVFSGDYMLSQYGVGKDGHPIQTDNGYEAFTPDMSNFIPNILLNFVTGYAHFAGKKVIFKENGDVEITGNLKSGSIGSFVIDKGLSNVKGDNIIDDKAYIHMEGKNCRFDLNSPGTVGLCDIRADGGSSTQKAIAQHLQTFGKHSIALKILCNAGGDNSSRAIESHGNVLLDARSGEKINANRFHANGLNVGTISYKASGTVPDDVDLIRTHADGTHTLTLPTPGSCTGKIYYLKNTSGTWVLHNGPFLPGNGWKQQDTYTVGGTQALQLISDGGNWCVFNGW